MHRSLTATAAWLNVLVEILAHGQVTHPRGFTCREVLGLQSVTDMRWPVCCSAARRLGYRFMCAEAAWVLSGDNRVATIAPYSKGISQFSDDGVFFYGAYGPKVVDQLPYVVDRLIKAPDTRQAVLNIWREKPAQTNDLPCTLSLQFQARGGLLHVMATLRSSDAWLGVPYDIFNFSMLAGYVCLLVRQVSGGSILRPGSLFFTAGNQHLYDTNLAQAEEAVRSMEVVNALGQADAFDPHAFASPQRLVDHLWALADKKFTDDNLYLTKELRSHYATKQG